MERSFDFGQEGWWVSFSLSWFHDGAKTQQQKADWLSFSTHEPPLASQPSSAHRLVCKLDELPKSLTHQKYE